MSAALAQPQALIADPVLKPGKTESWRAELALRFERRAAKTVLARRTQHGPLTLQKPFYPEGDEVCHCIVLHPPGGIVVGDTLALSFDAQSGSHALITTPGATKWYRSDSDAIAAQQIRIDVAPEACVEWLPQETIYYSGARVRSDITWRLSSGAKAFGWEIACLGRPAADERFVSGDLHLNCRIERDGELLWLERAHLVGDDAILRSPIGLRIHSVVATAYLAGFDCDAAMLETLREIAARADAQVGVTALPGVLLGRYLGDSAEHAREYFSKLWSVLRFKALHREPCRLRIWNT